METEEVTTGDNPGAVESGEVKPVNAMPPGPRPPTAEEGQVQPLMAEPPRPKTPAEKAQDSAQLSSTIEKPEIDGRSSAADKLVEAQLIGDNLVVGEIPVVVSCTTFNHPYNFIFPP